ncbi:unnamed protein product [Fusarium graminearum]|uniref:Chromosome 3, complete genome n=1 Tax=Gibberella zeae (strain ATCC MYA-4620 / CBS 123657 / FGSC 9075 / NRRL 31084 / PH-1) TaxID=229533 RepID=A0A098DWZ6_GIBZE|nr:unnamed protein product [Fusarium graminearum]
MNYYLKKDIMQLTVCKETGCHDTNGTAELSLWLLLSIDDFLNFRSGNNCYSEAYPSMNKGLAATYPAGLANFNPQTRLGRINNAEYLQAIATSVP